MGFISQRATDLVDDYAVSSLNKFEPHDLHRTGDGMDSNWQNIELIAHRSTSGFALVSHVTARFAGMVALPRRSGSVSACQRRSRS
jgi:hypothetical protein